MKTTKLFLTAALVVAVAGMGASRSKKVQCGVSNAQIASYLVNCSHHHTVYSVSDVPGTCNSTAAIENCGTAHVSVSDGIIIGHSDSNVNSCSINKKEEGNKN